MVHIRHYMPACRRSSDRHIAGNGGLRKGIERLAESTGALRYHVIGCRSGKVLRKMAYLPLAEDIPILFNACRQGPRSIDWRSDRDAEITWIEAQVRPLPPDTCTMSA